ncbi:MAG: hypothetical protein IPJ89_03330 [Candidatus Iainarchaeum archaeon]|uniref:Uncharacterized protein n=1 Tax=Candidatus Iainarchaeum sp. TaxID=3101447 RepID=A0A7T9I1C1_9ARCH|nr:MAG: hypothetical protein IPJ89_03330 [Candidatus Diapherotrites archaeon]
MGKNRRGFKLERKTYGGIPPAPHVHPSQKPPWYRELEGRRHLIELAFAAERRWDQKTIQAKTNRMLAELLRQSAKGQVNVKTLTYLQDLIQFGQDMVDHAERQKGKR